MQTRRFGGFCFSGVGVAASRNEGPHADHSAHSAKLSRHGQRRQYPVAGYSCATSRLSAALPASVAGPTSAAAVTVRAAHEEPPPTPTLDRAVVPLAVHPALLPSYPLF